MRFGNLTGEIDQNIIDLGFPVVNSITVLGFILQNSANMADANFVKIRQKILSIIRFWERFNLSLPGKISIYKTLLIPQINFIASVLTPSTEFLQEVSSVMEKFVTKGLNISKEKLYKNAADGGIGLFNLDTFISALQVSWIKRASLNSNDNWKVTLRNLANGNVLDCTLQDADVNCGLALKNILKSFDDFKRHFRTYGNNYLVEKISSDLFGTGRGQTIKFDHNFFGPELMLTHGQAVSNLTMFQLVINDSMVPYREFEYVAGFPISRQKYEKIFLLVDLIECLKVP
jgi:hypothetical protein